MTPSFALLTNERFINWV